MDRDLADQARLRQIADEQAALRRVATLVAHGAAPEEVFAAVAEEVGQLLRVELAEHVPATGRAGTPTSSPPGAAVGAQTSRWAAGGPRAGTTSPRWCSRPAIRPGSTATPIVPRARSAPPSARRVSARRSGRRSSSRDGCGARSPPVRPRNSRCHQTPRRAWPRSPIGGDGDREHPEPRRALARLAEEQAALRRVATLVARGVRAGGGVRGGGRGGWAAASGRSRRPCAATSPMARLPFVSQWGSVTARFPVGGRWMLGGRNVGTLVFQTGRPARVDYNTEKLLGPARCRHPRGGPALGDRDADHR